MAPKLPTCMTSALRGQANETSSIARTASISVPPWPPSRSGIMIPSRLASAICRATSQGKPSVRARSSAPGASARWAKPRTLSANMRCPEVSSKSIGSRPSTRFLGRPRWAIYDQARGVGRLNCIAALESNARSPSRQWHLTLRWWDSRFPRFLVVDQPLPLNR